ncbi:conserved protein of unknown function [Acidithiobacillus ferrivorans]|uniref:HNH endonuclease n=1 Tax=Acidithiobacillus ferrivorans TaxID=160808 RepID=A0A060UUB4_9PROT|nr:hypothetical protein [Acidithiobacillus ferrivorans]CDQ11916.1 conserved hypothetical protein [Acidithiobacillus ferrivorans]SMH65472.1 conserved protein of unknown function [Acidithiobacillus ferrivorans]
MLKPIHRVTSSPALAACQIMMQRLALWLCDQQVHAVDVTLINLQVQMPSQIEADWLWKFLDRTVAKQKLLQRAKEVADLSNVEKQGLTNWVHGVSNIDQHFGLNPSHAFPAQIPNNWNDDSPSWISFKTLLIAFYERGFTKGRLPYRSDGTPTDIKSDQVTYAKFVAEFRVAHKLDAHPDAREICVLCGGELKEQEVDHWINKANFPLLSVCADNLLPICGECNAGDDTKGQKPVHSSGKFGDWFHPYLRPAHGALALEYQLPKMAISCVAAQAADQPKVNTLNKLLNLETRWTREFKAEHRKKQKEAADRKLRGRGPHNLAELQSWLTDYRDGLVESEPNYEVHKVLAAAMLEPTRLATWQGELGLAP